MNDSFLQLTIVAPNFETSMRFDLTDRANALSVLKLFERRAENTVVRLEEIDITHVQCRGTLHPLEVLAALKGFTP